MALTGSRLGVCSPAGHRPKALQSKQSVLWCQMSRLLSHQHCNTFRKASLTPMCRYVVCLVFQWTDYAYSIQGTTQIYCVSLCCKQRWTKCCLCGQSSIKRECGRHCVYINMQGLTSCCTKADFTQAAAAHAPFCQACTLCQAKAQLAVLTSLLIPA